MEKLEIIGTAFSPSIMFDGDNNYFIVSGRSTPDDADAYFYKVIKYLENYLEGIKNIEITEDIIFRFKLIYYNTVSIRYLNSIMEVIDRINSVHKTKVIWEYESDDEYLQEMGEYFRDGNSAEFELIEIQVTSKKIINNKQIDKDTWQK